MSARIRIDAESAVPPYEQVRAQFAARIGDGRLPVGTRLPACGSSPPTWGWR